MRDQSYLNTNAYTSTETLSVVVLTRLQVTRRRMQTCSTKLPVAATG